MMSHLLGSYHPLPPDMAFNSLSAEVSLSPTQDSPPSSVHCTVLYFPTVTASGRFYILKWIL